MGEMRDGLARAWARICDNLGKLLEKTALTGDYNGVNADAPVMYPKNTGGPPFLPRAFRVDGKVVFVPLLGGATSRKEARYARQCCLAAALRERFRRDVAR
jgi:hypothetical protein